MSGRGSFLPAYIQTLGVPMFGNRTPFSPLEQIFTEKVRVEFQGRGRYQVFPTDTGVDGVVRGDILNVGAAPVGFNTTQQASRYRFTIIVGVSFTDVKQQKTLWENPALTFSDEYELTSASSLGLGAAGIQQESAAIDRLSLGLRPLGGQRHPGSVLMTPAQVRAAIAAATPAPIYLLESDDLPSRLELAQEFLKLVDEGLHAFNIAAFHAREATNAGDRDAMLSAIIGAARTLPMMSPRRVLLVHDAEVLLAPKRGKDEEAAEPPVAAGKRRPRGTTPAEDFEAYVERPEPMTTLVLDAASLDRGRRITKLLLKHALVVDCGTLDTPADAARWIKARLDRDEMTMDAAAVTALIDAAGLKLPRIRGAVDKLVLYAAGEGDDHRGARARRGAAGGGAGRGLRAGRRPSGTATRPRPCARSTRSSKSAPWPPMILGQIRAAVIRLRPDARARQALRSVLDTDLAIKSSQGEPRFVLERLVVEVCGGGPGGPPVRRPWA